MAKEITVSELGAWVEKNKHRVWGWEDPEFWKIPDKKRTMEIKYLHFELDTRDMKIFHIAIRGAGPDREVDFRDDKKDWSLLELLESKLKPVSSN